MCQRHNKGSGDSERGMEPGWVDRGKQLWPLTSGQRINGKRCTGESQVEERPKQSPRLRDMFVQVSAIHLKGPRADAEEQGPMRMQRQTGAKTGHRVSSMYPGLSVHDLLEPVEVGVRGIQSSVKAFPQDRPLRGTIILKEMSPQVYP